MTTISPELQRLMTEYGNRPEFAPRGGLSSAEYQSFVNAINTTPVLMERLNQGVAQGHVRQFSFNTMANAGATYSNGTISLGLSTLREASVYPQRMNDLVFQMGHEVQHGFDAAATAQAYAQFNAQVHSIAQSPNAVHNYTPAFRGMLAVNAHNEASSEVAGWNALVSHVKQTNPNPTLEDMYKSSGYATDFIEKTGNSYTVKPNISLNADMTMSMTPSNVQGMEQNFFHKSPKNTRLGAHGNSDYTNYYATYMTNAVSIAELALPTTHKVMIDMAGLKLNERLLEENGLTIGGTTHRQPYYDTAYPNAKKHFDNTKDTHIYVPINDVKPQLKSEEKPLSFSDKMVQAAQDKDNPRLDKGKEPFTDTVEKIPAQSAPQKPTPGPSSGLLTHPTHAGNGLYQQALGGLTQLNEQSRIPVNQGTCNLAACLAVSAYKDNLRGITTVMPSSDGGTHMFASDKTSARDVFGKHTQVPTEASMNTPMTQSTEAWNQVAQEKTQAQAQQKTQEQTQQQTQEQTSQRQASAFSH